MFFNFLGFAVLFIIARMALGYILPMNRIFLAVTSAIVAHILAPKCGTVQTDDGENFFMKWIFTKGIREI